MEPGHLRRSVKGRFIWLIALAGIMVALLWLRPFNLRRPKGATQIYHGIWYSCIEIDAGIEGSGLAHIVKIDLTDPEVELYITPVDPEAVKLGAQYRLTFAQSVADQERLAVVINATQFAAMHSVPLPGTLADSNETIVADGHVNHVHPHSFLLWFDDDLVPHLEMKKPPPAAALRQARWAISGLSIAMREGRPRETAYREPDRQTCIGIDSRRRLLWLAVFERTTTRLAMQMLAEHGAKEAIRVDSGDSSTMVIGSEAVNVDPGTVLAGQRPVATFFGIRARPLGGGG